MSREYGAGLGSTSMVLVCCVPRYDHATRYPEKLLPDKEERLRSLRFCMFECSTCRG